MRSWGTWIMAVALTAGLLFTAGCGTKEEAEAPQAGDTQHKMEGESGMAGEEAMPAEGDEATAMLDPVCGMRVSEDSEHMAEHEGQTYYFCSAQCRDTFLEDPAKHIQ